MLEQTLKVKQTIQISLALLLALCAGYWAGNTHGFATGVKSGSRQERIAWLSSPVVESNHQAYFKNPHSGPIKNVTPGRRPENRPDPRELPMR